VLFAVQEINFDSERGGVTVITEKSDVTTSYLLIQRAAKTDSGQYTCSPSNANSKSVTVHILAGMRSENQFQCEIGRIFHIFSLNFFQCAREEEEKSLQSLSFTFAVISIHFDYNEGKK
jgi:hypothetical protein